MSKARANYKTDKIQHTTTSELDGNKHSDDESDNFTSLKQMFVDIVAQDEHEYMVINEGKNQGTPGQVRVSRSDRARDYGSTDLRRYGIMEAWNVRNDGD